MPQFTQGSLDLHYECYGEGFPVLLFAPGGMRSAVGFWESSPWNPIEVLQKNFRVIAMDQRNAGASRGPITAEDSWDTYTQDHLDLLDYLEVDRCHLVGGCIGGAFSFNFLKIAPERVAAAVIQQSIGLDDNRQAFYDMFDSWAADQQASRPELSDSVLSSFRSNLYDHDFVFSASEAQVKACVQPLLVLMGQDLYHPESISRGIASLAPAAMLIESWKDEGESTGEVAKNFLLQHVPT